VSPPGIVKPYVLASRGEHDHTKTSLGLQPNPTQRERFGAAIGEGFVSLDYFDRPFRFNGKIFAVEVELTQGQGALRVA